MKFTKKKSIFKPFLRVLRELSGQKVLPNVQLISELDKPLNLELRTVLSNHMDFFGHTMPQSEGCFIDVDNELAATAGIYNF